MPETLVSYYQSLGITIRANGDKLRLEAPESVLTPEIQAQIKQQRAQIISELSLSSEPLTQSLKSKPGGAYIGSLHNDPIVSNDPNQISQAGATRLFKPLGPSQCQTLIAKYPDDLELWERFWLWIGEQVEQGADETFVSECERVLEQEWRPRE